MKHACKHIQVRQFVDMLEESDGEIDKGWLNKSMKCERFGGRNSKNAARQ